MDRFDDSINCFILTDDSASKHIPHRAQALVFCSRNALNGYAAHHTDYPCYIFRGDDIGGLVILHLQLGMTASPYFIHHVDRFVGESAVGQVTLAQTHTCFEHLAGVDHMVIIGIMVTQFGENSIGLVSCGRTDNYFLKTTFQCTIFLNGFGVLSGSGGADTLYLAACQSRFEDIGGI